MNLKDFRDRVPVRIDPKTVILVLKDEDPEAARRKYLEKISGRHSLSDELFSNQNL